MKGRTYHRLDYHVVFSTKHREPCLDDDRIILLRELFNEKAEELDIIMHIANGYKDHIHMLISIPPRLSVSHVMKHLKGYSSRMIDNLYWQEGYSTFTVDKTSFNRIFIYIFNQKEHHQRRGYLEELNSMNDNHTLSNKDVA